MNDARTSRSICAKSEPVRYELVSYRGEIFGPFESVSHAVQVANLKWPDQEQDEDRTGRGWDVQVAGCRDPE